LRALFDWLARRPEASKAAEADGAPTVEMSVPDAGVPSRIGHYAVRRRLGEGGMGVVYEAHDERLGRSVAVKMMSGMAGDETARLRFWREARAAASVNHPNICQIYEVGEDPSGPFIAMELLEGQSLADRLQQGALAVPEALPVGLGILAALSALHARGVVHRDLKPSNVFLTPHAVKLLDFGLARPGMEPALDVTGGLTRPGIVMGTPRYMAPEQATGAAVDFRADLFATGAILFEMLAGRPAFAGDTVVDILHATLHEQPPALVGSPAAVAADRVIRRALAKRPDDRPASADDMAAELRAIGLSGGRTPALARAVTRLVVLPFHVLRPDPETDFLAFSLPDAIATSLSGLGSLVVRSTASAARFASPAPDLKVVATEADVDRVVIGTVLRAGDHVRATAQLVEAPGGTLLTSHTAESPLGDLFRLQDDLARRVGAALSLPLVGDQTLPGREGPMHGGAYELYLRGNELARTYDGLQRARDLYQRALDLDPTFARAWAQLGRCHRVIGKYIEGTADSDQRAEEALTRALALDPRLSVAHKYYANLEADTGRAEQAVVRLLQQATRHGTDPELFAGLVHACRYCGLNAASVAAHAEARRLDPKIATSVDQTRLMMGDIEGLLANTHHALVAGADDGIQVIGLGMAGRREEALALLDVMEGKQRIATFERWTRQLRAWLERRRDDLLEDLADLGTIRIQDDPEAVFQVSWQFCELGAHAVALPHLRRSVAKGYFAVDMLRHSPHFDAIRNDPDFQAMLADAEAGRDRAWRALVDAGGERVLGLASRAA
jgi:serine/threonine protein kinase/tetratricopeptide (TPR) repeat protein